MARAGRKDRGLLMKKDSMDKPLWYVRLYHEGRERRFGSFPNKTKAREFYEKAKLEQKEGRFFPERYQHGGYSLTEELIAAHVDVSTVKNQSAEKHYGEWWKDRLRGKRLNAVTPTLFIRGGCQRGSQSRAGCVRSSRRLAIALMSSQPWRLRLKGRKPAHPHSRQHSQATVPSK